jgi:hypothetical protein
MSYSQDLCTVGRSGAFQGQVFGLSAGRTVRDENCERLKLSKYLYDTGMKVAAVGILCQDPRVFKAMQMAGTPCPYEGKIGSEAQASWIANPHHRPDAKEYKARLKADAKIAKKNKKAEAKRVKKLASEEYWTFIKACKKTRNDEGLRKGLGTCSKEWNDLNEESTINP